MTHATVYPSRVGVLLLDSQHRPVHFNAEAASILGYPRQLQDIRSLDAVLPVTRAQLASPTPSLPGTVGFTSGRRRYTCRTFLLDAPRPGEHRFRPQIVVILEREAAPHAHATRWSEQFQLTTRERETVEHLLKGLSSKEIASQMRISPSTVKSFLKLVMVKVGASNRAGIIAKILQRASCITMAALLNWQDFGLLDIDLFF